MFVKSVVVACGFVSAAGAAMAQADCSCGGTRVGASALPALLAGKTACASVATERWQEFHSGTTGGALIDYKLGPNHPVDPSETVGVWSIVTTGGDATGVVRYTYSAGGAFDYAVCQAGATVNFCGAGAGARNITGARLISGQVACP